MRRHPARRGASTSDQVGACAHKLFVPEDPTLAPLVPSLPTGDRGFESISLQLLEGLIDMGSCALHDRLEAAEPHPDQFPNTGLSIRPFVDHREPLRLVRAQRQNDSERSVLWV